MRRDKIRRKEKIGLWIAIFLILATIIALALLTPDPGYGA